MFDHPVVLVLAAFAAIAVFLVVRSNRAVSQDQPKAKGVAPKPYGRAADAGPSTPSARRASPPSGSFHRTRPQDREALRRAEEAKRAERARRLREEEQRRQDDLMGLPLTDPRHPSYYAVWGSHDDRTSRSDDRCDPRPSAHTHDDRPAACPDPSPSIHSYGDSSSYGGSSSDSYGGSSSSSYGGSDSSSSSSSGGD